MNLAIRNPKTAIFIGGVTVIGIWTGVAIANHKKKVQDQKAVAFFSELQRELAPDSVGLIESEAFDIKYWQDIQKKVKKKVIFLKGSEANTHAETIRSAWGTINDDENKIYGVFRALKDQVAVSMVAYFYYINIKEPKNKINLIDDLKSRLNSDEVKIILDIVKKLPKYRTA